MSQDLDCTWWPGPHASWLYNWQEDWTEWPGPATGWDDLEPVWTTWDKEGNPLEVLAAAAREFSEKTNVPIQTLMISMTAKMREHIEERYDRHVRSLREGYTSLGVIGDETHTHHTHVSYHGVSYHGMPWDEFLKAFAVDPQPPVPYDPIKDAVMKQKSRDNKGPRKGHQFRGGKRRW